ncbi:MAG: Rho-binding antiterminator [Pseudomonadota bacterium]|nr:Rho-binding antiterminator [Pseudomonadota bacterium]
MSDYIPIDCDPYCRYELAILHRQRLRVIWREPGGATHLETLLPLDLQTRHHAEYLLAVSGDGARRVLRLDRILRADPL